VEKRRERERKAAAEHSGYVELRQSRDVHAERIARVQVAGGFVEKFRRKCSSYMGTREVARYSALYPLTAVDSCRL